MAKEIAIIQVCFNLLDPYQRGLHERAAAFPNRSGYLKRLIQRDMDQQEALFYQTPQSTNIEATEDFIAEGFI